MASQHELSSESFRDPLTVGEADDCIREAQLGNVAALGKLSERCHRYLLLIANHELDDELRAKLGPSDIVQETLLKARRSIGRFEGRTDAELRAWLRVILLNSVRDASRGFRPRSKRDVSRERRLHDLLSNDGDARQLAVSETPSKQLINAERSAALKAALERLPADYRRVVLLRNIERRSFAEIGADLGRSSEAARKLWVRAVDQLRELLGAADDSL